MTYLPASVGEFPSGEALAERMRAVGLREVSFTPLTFGVATLYIGKSNWQLTNEHRPRNHRRSGAAYAVRLLDVLLAAGREIHLTISPAGQTVLARNWA